MEAALLEIIAAIKAGRTDLDAAWLDKLLRRHNRAMRDGSRLVAKRRLLPFYLGVRERDRERFARWEVDPVTEEALLRLLRMKPRRSASGVATITVITKPWPCSSACFYCPNDVRMPKSYLANEPACQRAERNYFDPYLQVRSRLMALTEMGHVTDKIELIILGGTWSDYPEAYQIWFVSELFRALNEEGVDSEVRSRSLPVMGGAPEERDHFYRSLGLTYDTDELAEGCALCQRAVNAGELSYNQAWEILYGRGAWREAADAQVADWDELLARQVANEDAAHRVVGLCIETRPDLVSRQSATTMRRLGCTKVQIGIQSLDEDILAANGRHVTLDEIAGAFSVLRRFGYKIQVHMMANLLEATPEGDVADYRRLVSDARFLPDEVKLYPCSLVESARLTSYYERGEWQPYEPEVLMEVLVADVLATPPYTRISRMIRDISATDIVAGNRRTNLRQMVEERVRETGMPVHEIRQREVATSDVSLADLRLSCISYGTSVGEEQFLQWVGEDGSIAGFLRLSLPEGSEEAMIREVHVYGRVQALHANETGGAQHAGLGRRLVDEACERARQRGYLAINVISSVGTRGYYRNLGFSDVGLYQRRTLV